MRAITCTQGALELTSLPDPAPQRGQLLLEVTYAGICGSDLHARHHADELHEVMAELDYADFMSSASPVVMGHEFTGTVLEPGPRTRPRLRAGTPVVAMPLVRVAGRTHLTGLAAAAPGAYAERVLTQAALTFPVPNGLPAHVAALTEPLAVAHHVVRRSDITRKDVAVVLGCGPVGLAVICHLAALGVRTIVASDPSPARRELATRCGAHVVVDPTQESPYDVAGERGWLRTAPELLDLAVEAMTRLRRAPGWSHVYRLAQAAGATDRSHPVVFECVGLPGMIEGIVSQAPLGTRVVVAGVCMGKDVLRPSMAVNKEIDLRFALGYTPLEFRDTLHQLAEGTVDATPLVTGVVGLEGVPAAFDALGGSPAHAKILVDPARGDGGTDISAPPLPRSTR